MRRALARRLDRRGCRGLLAAVASAFVSIRRRQRCRVHHVDGVWCHRFADGIVFDTRVTTMTPSLLDARARDVFLHAYVPREGDTILDVGAGTGSELRTFSRLVAGTGRVVAVEAHPLTFRCLQRTARWYGLDNVTLVHAAVGDRDGQLCITDAYAGRGNTVVAGGGRGLAVPAVTLDQLAARYGLGDIALLKMNIEGAERLAIEGMRGIVGRIRNVAISCHDFKAIRTGQPSFASRRIVARFLREHGYDVVGRPHDPRPSVSDYLYGARRARDPAGAGGPKEPADAT